MSYTRSEVREIGKGFVNVNQVGDIRVASVLREFRDRFGFTSAATVAKAAGLDPSFYTRVEKAKRNFAPRSLTSFLIGSYELVMATQPSRRLEYYEWCFKEFLPAVYAATTDAYEQRRDLIEEKKRMAHE